MPDLHAVASAVELILNQRLLRRVCRECNGAGCAACFATGYHGRVPVVEWCRVDDTVRAQLLARGAGAIQPVASLEVAAQELVKSGVTNAAERERIFGR